MRLRHASVRSTGDTALRRSNSEASFNVKKDKSCDSPNVGRRATLAVAIALVCRKLLRVRGFRICGRCRHSNLRKCTGQEWGYGSILPVPSTLGTGGRRSFARNSQSIWPLRLSSRCSGALLAASRLLQVSRYCSPIPSCCWLDGCIT